MLFRIFFTVLAVLVYLYFFWSRLKEDYIQNQIFTSAFYALLGIALGSIIADNFAPDWWFWISFPFSFAGLMLGIFRFKLRMLETLEAGILASLSLFGNLLFYDYLIRNNLTSFFAFIVMIIMIIIFFILNKHYKRLSWYKSGRVGFSGLTVFGVFFLLRGIIAMTGFVVLSFVGVNDLIMSAVLSFTAFLLVFNLARKT